MAALLVGCAGAVAGPTQPATLPDADATIRSGAMEFSTRDLQVPAEREFSILYVNEGPLPHNVAVYTDESAGSPLFKGEIIERAQVVYHLPALGSGEYFFRCDLHPEMNGKLSAG